MSVFLGKVNNIPVFHITTTTNIADAETTTANDSTVFHSNMELFNVLNREYLTFLSVGQESIHYQCSFDLENAVADPNTIVFIIVEISGAYYINCPDNLIKVSAYQQYANNLQTEYVVCGNMLHGFWNTTPTNVIAIKAQRFQPSTVSEIDISRTFFKINGIDFSLPFLALSTTSITSDDISFNANGKYITIANSSQNAVGWFLDNASFGRFTSTGALNYFAKSGTTVQSKFRKFTSFVNSFTFSTAVPLSFLVISKGFFPDVRYDNDDVVNAAQIAGNYYSWLDSSLINVYIPIGRPRYLCKAYPVTFIWYVEQYAIKFDGSTIKTYRSYEKMTSAPVYHEYTGNNALFSVFSID